MEEKNRKILVALDFTEKPEEILKRSLSVAEKYDAKIFIVHVIEDMPKISFYSDAYKLWEEFRDKAVKETIEKINKYILELSREFNFKDIEAIVEVGDSATRIVEQAEKVDADLIILGNHGRKGIKHFIHRNVCLHVIRMTTRPVLTFYTGS